MVGTPGELARRLAGVHRQLVAGHDPPAGDLRAAHPQHVFVRVEAELVVDPDRRDHRPEFARELLSHRPDASHQAAALARFDQRHEAEADRQLERVDRGRRVGGAAPGG